MNAPARNTDRSRLTEEQYAVFMRSRPEEERWQLIDGVAIMMPPPTLRHQRIGMNLARRLNNALESKRPELFALLGAGLKIEGFPAFLPVPDMLVIDEAVGEGSYANRFYLTAEILSDSNTREYMSLKVERYSAHPSNLYSLIIDQKEISVEIWSRASDWKGVVLRAPDDVFDLPEFGFRCELRDLYRGTPLA